MCWMLLLEYLSAGCCKNVKMCLRDRAQRSLFRQYQSSQCASGISCAQSRVQDLAGTISTELNHAFKIVMVSAEFQAHVGGLEVEHRCKSSTGNHTPCRVGFLIWHGAPKQAEARILSCARISSFRCKSAKI